MCQFSGFGAIRVFVPDAWGVADGRTVALKGREMGLSDGRNCGSGREGDVCTRLETAGLEGKGMVCTGLETAGLAEKRGPNVTGGAA